MYIAFGLVASASYILLLRRENARRDRGERDEFIENLPETHTSLCYRRGSKAGEG